MLQLRPDPILRTGYSFLKGTHTFILLWADREKVTALLNGVWNYLEAQIESALNGTVHNLQPWFVEAVASVGMQVATSNDSLLFVALCVYLWFRN